MHTCKEDGVIKNYGRKNSKRCGLCVTFRESPPRFGRFRLVTFHWVEITEMDATSDIGKEKGAQKQRERIYACWSFLLIWFSKRKGAAALHYLHSIMV